MRFKIDWASLIVGSKFTVFALFYFVFEGNFQVQAPRGGGADVSRNDLTEGFLRYQFGGFIFGGACTWRGLFSEFYGIDPSLSNIHCWNHLTSSNVWATSTMLDDDECAIVRVRFRQATSSSNNNMISYDSDKMVTKTERLG